MSSFIFARSLFVTASSIACVAALAVPAHAQSTSPAADEAAHSRPVAVENEAHIVIRDDLTLDDPPPTGVFDNSVDVTGVGQMTVRGDQNSFGLGLCTGTLINPRTVLFAAHCVNSRDADDYGFASGGTAIAFGFSADNLPAVRRWVGLDDGVANETDVDFNIYNVEQVWYDERSVPLGFLEADVALATLDTHADGVPTWTVLFSPLREETHGVINGYGARGLGPDGANLGIDFRRRIAENMISSASSLDDRNNFLFGPGDPALPQTLYNTDFDSPDGEAVFDSENGRFDFDLYDGAALPREGTTAGGDSGSALVADELYDKPVITSVLSGGSRFFGAEDDPDPANTFQPFSSYGTQSFYQPLYLFWDQIVANNAYVYASSRAGTRNWLNPRHWVQDIDPNYAIDVDGELVNALPGFEAPGVTGDTPKFGNVCFLDDCQDLSTLSVELDEGAPNSVFIEGGPGSRNFVPNNVVADPSAGIRARYYEVTLAARGATRLRDDVTIDRLSIEGAARLDIRRRGNLKVWGDYTQTGGWLDLRGTLTTGEAFLGVGLLTGDGLFDPTFLTSVNGSIAPGRNFGDTGTLTVAGDVILASGTLSIFDVGRRGGDKLAVIGDSDNPGIISLGGTAAVINKFGRASARFGQTFEIVTAEGGVENSFDNVVGRIGVLYPELIYGPNNVTARMRAIRFSDFFNRNGVTNAFSLAFGNALDDLRDRSFTDLANVFGLIDVMEVGQLSATFQSLSASQAGRTTTLDQQQASTLRNLVSDRLSLMGFNREAAGRIKIVGAPGVLNNRQLTNSSAALLSFAGNYKSSSWSAVQLPENMSGFMSAGYNQSALAFGRSSSEDRQGSWHIAMGLELDLDDRSSFGTAVGYANGAQEVSGSLANVATNQASVYGNYRLDDNFYIGGQASMTHSRIDSDHRISGATALTNLNTSSLTFASEIEAGYNIYADGLVLTPRASIGYASYSVDGFRDATGDLGLAVDGIGRAGFEAKVGFKISGQAKMRYASSWTFQPEMKIDFVNRISGNDTSFRLRFLEAENLPFALPIGLQDASYGELKGGFSFANGPLNIGAAVESRIGQQIYRDNRAVLNMAVRF
ncbi:MAG: autotransporter domain-containing protein [Parasphingorhabdus sp.]|uniref:autotransporter domain-containing protein n=1 Tax=Parasphingorhabdus sp. TaxID=2709688 RepID=UPI00329A689E